jgi:hypothetical protein
MHRSTGSSDMERVVIDGPPLPLGCALKSLAASALRTVMLLGRRRLHQPRDHVGRQCSFADGTTSVIYRETVVDRVPPRSPAALVVSFRLRHVHSARAHALFRLESVLNTVLFAGFPGFVSKLWMAHDDNGVYRGVYDWDEPVSAEAYVRALWWALALVSHSASIHYAVLPGLRRDELLRDPDVADAVAADEPDAWWRPIEIERLSGERRGG